MITAFDHIARGYDAEFSNSAIGVLQRKQVHAFLETSLEPGRPLDILELNCGTGEDALWFGRRHHRVLATDISERMIEVARQKAGVLFSGGNIAFEVMDLLDAAEKLKGRKFDLVFSNFGGFNCLDNHQLANWLGRQLPALLNPGGKLIAVIMPRFCAWETLYFLSKFRFRKAFRRLTGGPVAGKLSPEVSVNTWYHSPRWVRHHLPEGLRVTDIKPVGMFIPPSCLNHFFADRPSWLKRLAGMEKKMAQVKAAAAFSDHFLIEVQLPAS